MAEVNVSESDIVSLRERLAGIEAEWSEAERALLAAVFQLAIEAIHRTADPPGGVLSRVPGQPTPVVVVTEGPLPSVREQFDRAFTPGPLPEPGAYGATLSVNIVGSDGG